MSLTVLWVAGSASPVVGFVGSLAHLMRLAMSRIEGNVPGDQIDDKTRARATGWCAF
jgi:hypothetical protein